MINTCQYSVRFDPLNGIFYQISLKAGVSPEWSAADYVCCFMLKLMGIYLQHPVLKEKSDVIKNQYRWRRMRKIFFVIIYQKYTRIGVEGSFDSDVWHFVTKPIHKER